MLENPDACTAALKVLQAYCAHMRAGRGDNPQRFIWGEGGLLDDHGRLFDPTVPAAYDLPWQRLVAKTLRAEGFTFTPTDDGFAISIAVGSAP